MVAIVTGGGLGSSSRALGLLGTSRRLGAVLFGHGTEGIYVNAATGNLILRRQHEFIVGPGSDSGVLRSYNSQGVFNGLGEPNWRLRFSRKVKGLTGRVNTPGSTVLRVDEDCEEKLYAYDGNLYVSANGGAFDTLAYIASLQRWIWSDRDTRNSDTYDAARGGRLIEAKDHNGSPLTFGYKGGRLATIKGEGEHTVHIEYDAASGGADNILQVRTVSAERERVRTRYSYDTSNRLRRAQTDLTALHAAKNAAAGGTYASTYIYDGRSGRVAGMAQSDGSRLEFSYVEVSTGDHRIHKVRDIRNDGDVSVTEFSYDLAGRKTTIRDSFNQLTELLYDSNGRFLSVKAYSSAGIVEEKAMFPYVATTLCRMLKSRAKARNHLVMVRP
jgi:hypothetical protein